MEHKALAVELKQNQAGAFRAIFATFNQVDHDGDVTLPGAFPVGAKVPIAGVGHNWDVPTIGNGTIGADSEKAWLDGRFNLKMDAGRETYESIKFDADEGVNAQQYSYAYDVGKGHSARPDEQKKWPGAKRILEQLVPHEVSPVLLGAGMETGTAFVKGRRGRKAGPLSYEDRRDLLQEAVNAWDVAEDAAEGEPTEPFDMGPYLEETYDDHVIVDDDGDYFSIPYTIAADGTVTLGEAVPVERTWTAKTLATRASRLLTDTSAFAKHARAAVAMRAKEGRVLSTANHERISKEVEALKAAIAQLQALLAETAAQPKGADAPAHLRSLHAARMARLAREFRIPLIA